jgi:hypothetical protein
MNRISWKIAVATITFLLGVSAVYLIYPLLRSSQIGPADSSTSVSTQSAELCCPEAGPTGLNADEAKMVRQAEYHVCWNGYTRKRCGGVGVLDFGPCLGIDCFERLRAERYDTLEGRAYGLAREETKRSTVWRVVFRYTERAWKNREKFGCAYVIEDTHQPYENRNVVGIRCDFPLKKVEKVF